MKSLPIGISTLSTIVDHSMIYIDKTASAFNLIREPGRYFLSRPRRFGKSLFVDTLKEIFEGNEPLFRGLYIHDKWDWNRKYPVIKIDFAGGVIKNTDDLNNKLESIFMRYEQVFEITICSKGNSNRFNELIVKLSEKYGSQVIVLIDEYDKPLLDNIENPAMNAEIRDGLKNLYSVIKDRDSDLYFVFLTGVSKFSKVSIFSGINNLEDITLDANYAAICGYTQYDLETSFAEHLKGVDWNKLREWYNGYNFLGEPVYNPFDILLFISKNKEYRNYWFETGTPTFLIKLFKENRYFLPDLDNIELGEELLSSFEIGNIQLPTLLFQTGYLTIDSVSDKMGRFMYKLKLPNREVAMALTDSILSGFTELYAEKYRYQSAAWDALMAADLSGLEQTIKRLFAGIPWRNFTNNDLIDYEGYYASVLYAFFTAINCTVIPEDINNHGQADITIKLGDNIYVIEIKVIDRADELTGENNPALEQIKERGYADKYAAEKEGGLFEVGMVFSREARNLVMFSWDKRQ